MIFLVLSGKTLEENLSSAERFRPYLDGAELRADYLEDPAGEDWKTFFDRLGLPAVLTVRKPEDGGKYEGSEGERRALFLALLGKGRFSYVDLEEGADLPEVEEKIRAQGGAVIRSFHDFTGVPRDLAERIRNLPRGSGEIPKAAVLPRSTEDFNLLIETFLALRGTKKILLGMGEFGFPSRILAPRLGSFLTFASPEGNRLAPGLIDPETLAEVYRYHEIGPETRINGIIGNPILHSRSPHLHNSAYARLGIDAVYVPFHVDSVESFRKTAELLDLGGVSVTVPFKEAVIPLCRETEEAVKVIGACNTLVRSPEGFSGYNTDAEGFLAPLDPLYGGRKAAGAGKGFLQGVEACVIGAGGAARSVVYALAKEGASVLVLNRTKARAEKLVRDIERSLGLERGRLAAAGTGAAGSLALKGPEKLIVQATTVGMHPAEEEDALPAYTFAGDETVYDIVYSPRETVFLKRALAAGCRIIHGEAMLKNQAYRQFLLYTGRIYPSID